MDVIVLMNQSQEEVFWTLQKLFCIFQCSLFLCILQDFIRGRISCFLCIVLLLYLEWVLKLLFCPQEKEKCFSNLNSYGLKLNSDVTRSFC